MKKTGVPAEIRRFVLTSVPSVPYLEAVLLLRGEAQTRWDAALLARRLYVSDRVAADLMQQLLAHGVAQAAPGGGCTYGPGGDLRSVLDLLAEVYAADLVGVTDLIHSRIDKRAQQFADAFRFRKE